MQFWQNPGRVPMESCLSHRFQTLLGFQPDCLPGFLATCLVTCWRAQFLSSPPRGLTGNWEPGIMGDLACRLTAPQKPMVPCSGTAQQVDHLRICPPGAASQRDCPKPVLHSLSQRIFKCLVFISKLNQISKTCINFYVKGTFLDIFLAKL